MKKHKTTAAFVALALTVIGGCRKEPETTIKVGHVGHDHHLALFVAADNATSFAQSSGIGLKAVEDRQLYELSDRGRKLAEVEIVKVGGGSKMPTALAQGVIEVGYGGVAPVLASVDSGAPVKLIAPLHYKGDMFVVKPDFPAKTWTEFVALARKADKPIRIGYKDPVAVAKLVFEEALKHEAIPFGGDLSETNLKVHMINVKGGDKLNVALAGDLVDGYVGNNPFPAIAAEKNIGRIVCDLEELPPGTFRNHPCCCIAATAKVLKDKPEAVTDLLVLFLQATEAINTDLDAAVAAATRWIGTSEAVERMSIPTSGYSMEDSAEWRATMATWIEAMGGLNQFKGTLKDVTPDEAVERAYDFSLLEKARQKLAERRKGQE